MSFHPIAAATGSRPMALRFTSADFVLTKGQSEDKIYSQRPEPLYRRLEREKKPMTSSFSTVACYASLTSCANTGILNAYARMLAMLIQVKRYETCDIDTLCADFNEYFGIHIPYHPMQTIINECIALGYLHHNPATHQLTPDYALIDEEGFGKTMEDKSNEYRNILIQFDRFLSEKYKIHDSFEALNERVWAFVERYGIKTTVDREILKKTKNDYLFADFLVSCEEGGKAEVLDYLNEYTVGLALSEIFTYCEWPENYIAKGAKVYIDAGIIFKILGIDSSNRSEDYLEFLKNIRRLGMQVAAYEHTVNEVIGIIEGARCWIGNPAYDASQASEAAYYFVSNSWTVAKVDELSCTLRTKLTNEYNITIDKTEYPKKEDIKAPDEADIKDMIIAEYKETNPSVIIEALDYSIDQDARSIFLTQHKNGRVVPYHINDVKNIFITLNRSLARVGYDISRDLASSKARFIPVVMTDIKWGTLIWFNNPATISMINRPRLVSAAYAAFRPTADLTRKLNAALVELEKAGKVTPEECYLLKVNPVAQRLLTKKTVNSPDEFFEETPLEILKELRDKAYEEGSLSRQDEIDALTEQTRKSKTELDIERQKGKVEAYRQEQEKAELEISHLKDALLGISSQIAASDLTKDKVRKAVRGRMIAIRLLTSGLILFLIGVIIHLVRAKSWVPTVLSSAAALFLIIIDLWKKETVTVFAVMQLIERKITEKQSDLRRYSEADAAALLEKKEQLKAELQAKREQSYRITICLNREKEELERLTKDDTGVTV